MTLGQFSEDGSAQGRRADAKYGHAPAVEMDHVASVVALEGIRQFLLPVFFASCSGFLTLLVMWLHGITLFTRFIVGARSRGDIE